MSEIYSRDEAKDLNIEVYFDGEECEHGHIADKLTSSGCCTECISERNTDVPHSVRVLQLVKKARSKRKNSKIRGERVKAMILDEEEFHRVITHRLYNHKARKDISEYARVGDITSQDILDIYYQQEGLCKACFSKFTEVGFDIEHRVSLSAMGSHTKDNIQLLCKSCNNKKRSREYESWISEVRANQVREYLEHLQEQGF
ncbi:HNH endonuclease [compost metagenome]